MCQLGELRAGSSLGQTQQGQRLKGTWETPTLARDKTHRTNRNFSLRSGPSVRQAPRSPPADPETSVKGPQKYCQPAKTPKTRKPLLTCQSRHGRGTGNQLCFLMKVSKVFGPRQECICNLKNHKNTESTHKNRITAKQQPHML